MTDSIIRILIPILVFFCMRQPALVHAQEKESTPPSSEFILDEIHLGLRLGIDRETLKELSPGLATVDPSNFYEAREPDGRMVDFTHFSEPELVRYQLKEPSPDSIRYNVRGDRLRSITWHRFARQEGAQFSEGINKFMRLALKTADRKFFKTGGRIIPVLQYHEDKTRIDIYYWEATSYSPMKLVFFVAEDFRALQEKVFASEEKDHHLLYEDFEKHFKE